MSANQTPNSHDIMWQTLSGLGGGSPTMTPREQRLFSEHPFHAADAARCHPRPASGKPRMLTKWLGR